VSGRRQYGDPCGIARGLDVVGERWALLIARELLLGPRRFTDLRTGLPGASPNVLSQRLDELQEAGVVQRHRLPAPAASWVYELTPWGHGLEDVLLAMARWGSQSAAVPDAELSPRALLLAMRTTYAPASPDAAASRIELHLDDESFVVTTGSGAISVAAGAIPSPDAVVSADAAALRAVIFGDRTVADGLASGALRIEGDRAAAAAMLTSFRRPQLAVRAGQQSVRRSDR
jgi:DNA-binding HxlR family transcriptional regulator/putative sterol carrier protein